VSSTWTREGVSEGVTGARAYRCVLRAFQTSSQGHCRAQSKVAAGALQLEHTPDEVGLIGNQGVLAVLFFLFGIARS
jgi:hypothetical protein